MSKKTAARTRPSAGHRAHGFSLLEMSVVIAIIGLLVGGILGGRTFLANAELKSLVSEAQNYIATFNQFHSKYNAMPGDFGTATTVWPGVATNGDGNGIIREGATVNNPEFFISFQHLALAGMIKGSYTGTTKGAGTAVADIGVNIPASLLPNVGYVFKHPSALDGNVTAATGTYFAGQYGHVLIVAGNTNNAMPDTGFLTTRQTLQIDDKFDDGNPGRGWILVQVPAVNGNNTECANTNTSAAVYNVNVPGKLCYLILNIPGT